MNSTKTNAVNWFELNVTDFDRARKFYEAALQLSLQEFASEGCRMGMFPHESGKGIGGAITKIEGHAPGAGGTMVYLNVEGDLDGVVARVPAAGGKVLKPRTAIGEHGFIAILQDTEGNAVGLHSLV
jgi:predicted enzyme related to lactoylglutathione lyase